MMNFLKNLFRREEGAQFVEYAILIVLIAVVAAIGLNAFGDGVSAFFNNLGQSISGLNTVLDP
jgi:Flp pilus assembly pilin Flp